MGGWTKNPRGASRSFVAAKLYAVSSSSPANTSSGGAFWPAIFDSRSDIVGDGEVKTLSCVPIRINNRWQGGG
jgi:hypothetical protein